MQKIFITLSFLFLLALGQNAEAQKCKANFVYQVHDTTNEYNFSFSGTTITGSTFVWDFGDGKTGTSFYVNHTYAAKNTYKVCLFRDSGKACKDTVCQYVVANKTNPCNAEYTAIQDNSNYLKWNFKAQDTLEEYYNWANTGYAKKTSYSYTFSSSGTYYLYLSVLNSNDHCIDTVVKKIIVKPCTAEFTISINQSTKTATFTNLSSSNITNYKWLFGDGDTSSAKNPSHTYTKAGKYWVTLKSSDTKAKCDDTIGMSITINGCVSNYFYNTMVDTTLYYYNYNPGKNKIKWDFGNGNYSTKDSSKYIYTKPGTYKVCLTTYCSGGDSAVSCTTMVASNKCRPGFTYSSNNLTIQFYDNSNSKSSYWTFGDGKGSSTVKNPSYKYTKPGKYWVTQSVYSSSSSFCDSTHFLITVIGCDGGFTATQTKYSSIYFLQSTKKGYGMKHRWLVNGVNINTKLDRDTLTYLTGKKGYYTICHVLMDSTANCTDTTCKTIYTGVTKCDSSFTYKVGHDTVYFNYTAGAAKVLRWDFGTSYTIDSAKHVSQGFYVYPTFGIYKLCMTAYCSSTSSSINCINAVINPKCDANFDYIVDTTNKYKVRFYNRYPSSINHTWYFGDGKTSASSDPIYSYSTYNTYNACHVIKNAGIGCKDSVCKTITAGSARCDSSFSYKISGDSVYFNYTGTALKSRWDFGNGYSYANTGKNGGDYLYTKPGTYNFCHIASCSSKDSTKKCISITTKSKSCKADFTYKPDTKYKIIFSNLSTGSSSTKYFWYFGNGYSSTSQHPQTTYDSAGKYTVCLQIKDSSSAGVCKDSICKSITVTYPECDSFFTKTHKGDSLSFAYKGNASKVRYNFGDGNTSTSKTGIHYYAKPGTYNVCLWAICSSSDSSQYCDTFTIKSKCQALFSVALDTTQKFKLFLINKSSNASSNKYKWHFGDGDSSSSRNPSHKYSSFGKFKICIEVKDTTINCTSKYCDSIGLDSNGKLKKAGAWELVVLDQSIFGTNKIVTSDFKIYPNPANKKVTVDLSTSTNKYQKIEILNANGQICILQTIETGSETIEVDLERLNKGLYLIKLSNDQGYSYTRMMKN